MTFDFLSEVTMSILARARAKEANAGYATDFVNVVMRSIVRPVAEQGIGILSNAGGINPHACAAALKAIAEEQGVSLKIAVVEGDDLMPKLADFRRREVKELHSGMPLPSKLMSANAYLGALPIADALKRGAQVVITGRCVDSALPLAALIHEFGWSADDYDKLAAGSLAGHLIECGPQCTGGLFTDWQTVPDWENIGYPIIECFADGGFVVTKPAGTGGLVTPATVAEQMVYEIGDPAAYLLPDVICDFTGVRMSVDGLNRVRVEGARGRAPSNDYKVSATYADGWRAVANLTLIGGDAKAKAARTAEAIIARTRRMLAAKGFADYLRVYSEILGTEALFGPNSRIASNREVVLRLVAEHRDPKALELFASEISPSGVSYAPGTANVGTGRAKPMPIVRLFSFMAPKTDLAISTTLDGDTRQFDLPRAKPSKASAQPSVYGDDVRAPSGEATVELPLGSIAHGRSGDKGDSANVGIIARHPKWVPVLRQELTAERVRNYFAHLVEGTVQRFDVPGIGGFNFLMLQALAGGGMASPRSDALGKSFAQMLLDIPIAVPVSLVDGVEPFKG